MKLNSMNGRSIIKFRLKLQEIINQGNKKEEEEEETWIKIRKPLSKQNIRYAMGYII